MCVFSHQWAAVFLEEAGCTAGGLGGDSVGGTYGIQKEDPKEGGQAGVSPGA